MKNSTPEISVNKLAEFVHATDARKWTILKSIRSSQAEDFTKRIRYASAKSSIRNFLLDEKHDPKIFEEKRTSLLGKELTSDFKINDRKNSLLAIQHLEKCSKTILVPYCDFTSKAGLPKEKRQAKIDGVIVHLTPDVVFLEKQSETVRGALKLVFSKGKSLTPFEGQVISGLLKRHLEKEYKRKISPEHCFVLDVFARRMFVAPNRFTYHRTQLKKAFSEINALWNKVA